MLSSNCFNFLTERGLVSNCTNPSSIDTPQTIYAGFDLTAKSLHVGSLVLIRSLEILSKFGHKIIILTGSGTSQIGDPTGKTKQRKTLENKEIEENKEGIIKTIKSIIKYDLKFVDNIDWLKEIGYIEMLQKYSIHISVNKLVKTELVKTRLESNLNLSFLELNYSILQSIDFVILHEKHQCNLQIGGNDQWTNIVSGVELGQRMGYNNMNGLTIPLLINKNGVKMGKTEEGAVWLDPLMTSPYDFWQYFRSIDDSFVEKLLLIFSDKPTNEIQKIVNENINNGKIELANTLVEYVHGPEWVEKIKQSLEVIYNGADFNLMPEDLRVKLETEVNESIRLDKLLTICGIENSLTQSANVIRSGQVKINDEKILDPYFNIIVSKNKMLKLSFGKHINKIIEFF